MIREICSIVPGPVSAEVAGTDYDEIMREAMVLREIANNVTIKVPLTPDGLRACKHSADGHDGERDAVLLGGAGAAGGEGGCDVHQPVRGPAGRHRPVDGMELISDIVEIYQNYASRRKCWSPRSAARTTSSRRRRWAPHVATLPPAVLRSLFNHPLTEKGLAQFLKDWQGTGQSII